MSLVDRLGWDSSFFGFPIGRVRDTVAASEIESAVREADKQALRCVYLLASADDDALIDSAQRHGFLVRDIRVELERPVMGHPKATAGLRRGDIDDMPRLAQIARERFKRTRFSVDSGFPPDRSTELYAEWLRKGLSAESGLVTLVTKELDGFIVCDCHSLSRAGKIELTAVAADAAGRGLGSSLVAGAGALFAETSLLTSTVVTQGHNIAAQRLYQSQGYRSLHTYIWLHRWHSPGPA